LLPMSGTSIGSDSGCRDTRNRTRRNCLSTRVGARWNARCKLTPL